MKKILKKRSLSKIIKILFWSIFWVVNIFEFSVFVFFQWLMFVYPVGQEIERSADLVELSKNLYYLSALNSVPMIIINTLALGIVVVYKKKINCTRCIIFIVYLLISILYSFVQIYSFF